jgi:hypothetical protein
METPTRPFTIGGQTLSQARKAVQTPQAAATPASSQQKKNVSFKSSAFPSPPSHRLTFTPGEQQQQQQPQPYHVQQYAQPSQSSVASSSAAAPTNASTSSLPRSTSAPNILPAPGTARTSQQHKQMMMFGQQQLSSRQSVTSSLEQAKQGSKQTPQKPTSSSRFDTVPVDPKLAMEARRATMAKALRVNLVMLLVWYLITDSRLYSYVLIALLCQDCQSF